MRKNNACHENALQGGDPVAWMIVFLRTGVIFDDKKKHWDSMSDITDVDVSEAWAQLHNDAMHDGELRHMLSYELNSPFKEFRR